MKSFEARAAFIRANTSIQSPPLVPEIRLHLAHEAVPLWEKTEEQLGEMGLPPPFWAFAWAGGQALARYVLDNPDSVRGKRVIDLASGSGLVGLAAMQAGAASVLAADIDEFAVVAMKLNAQLNTLTFNCHDPLHASAVRLTFNGTRLQSNLTSTPALGGPLMDGRGDLEHRMARQRRRSMGGPPEAGHDVKNEMRPSMIGTNFDLLRQPAPACDIILVGDLFYEKSIAEKLYAWLLEAKSRGIESLVGDPGRTYLPKNNLTKVTEYLVPVTRDLEDAEIKRTAVWRLAG